MAQLHLDSPFFVPNAATNPFRPVARTVEPELEGPSTYAMVQNGPPVAASEVEQIGATAIEVMLLWGDNVLHVEHLSPRVRFTWVKPATTRCRRSAWARPAHLSSSWTPASRASSFPPAPR